MSGGFFCISIDVERAWGIWDKPSAEYHRLCEATERRVVDSLVSLFDEYQVPATWAVVARLAEPDGARPGSPALWQGLDTLDRIRAARQPQEIGSHSYAHVYYGQIGRDEAARDVQAAARVHRALGLDFTSFVFPRNDVAHLDVLRAAGIRVFRSVDQGIHTRVRRTLGRLAGRAANLAEQVLPVPPPAVRPVVRAGGLVELPSSMLLMSRNGARRIIHPRVSVLKARLGLEAAAQSGGVFHLWFHPSNFYYETERQLETLRLILKRACTLRDRGQLEIRPMGAFATAPESLTQ